MTSPTRSCDGCTLCCKLFPVPALEKPANVWCKHCIKDTGCGIHTDPSRPELCGQFLCGYIREPMLGPEWKPSVCHMVLIAEENVMVAGVDQDYPDAWTHEPYYSTLRNWAIAGSRSGAQVLISIGQHVLELLPDGRVARVVFDGTGS